MIISLEEDRKESKAFLKKYALNSLLSNYWTLANYLPQFIVLPEEPMIKSVLLFIVALRHLSYELNNLAETGSLLRKQIIQKEDVLIKESEALARKLSDRLFENNFHISLFPEIQSLPGGPVLPEKYEFLKKDDVEIHYQISTEGVQVYICLPGNHESNHRFVQAQDLYQGDAYLVNSESLFFSSDEPFTEEDIKEILDLVQYGSAIIYYANKRNKK